MFITAICVLFLPLKVFHNFFPNGISGKLPYHLTSNEISGFSGQMVSTRELQERLPPPTIRLAKWKGGRKARVTGNEHEARRTIAERKRRGEVICDQMPLSFSGGGKKRKGTPDRSRQTLTFAFVLLVSLAAVFRLVTQRSSPWWGALSLKKRDAWKRSRQESWGEINGNMTPTSSPGPSPRRFSKWRIVGRRPWHTAEITWPICPRRVEIYSKWRPR